MGRARLAGRFCSAGHDSTVRTAGRARENEEACTVPKLGKGRALGDSSSLLTWVCLGHPAGHPAGPCSGPHGQEAAGAVVLVRAACGAHPAVGTPGAGSAQPSGRATWSWCLCPSLGPLLGTAALLGEHFNEPRACPCSPQVTCNLRLCPSVQSHPRFLGPRLPARASAPLLRVTSPCVCGGCGCGRRCLCAAPRGRGEGKKIPFDSFFFLLFSHH